MAKQEKEPTNGQPVTETATPEIGKYRMPDEVVAQRRQEDEDRIKEVQRQTRGGRPRRGHWRSTY